MSGTRKARPVTVFTVLFYDARSEGPAGDHTHVRRFRERYEAEQFAKGRECYGQPARVDQEDDVPRHLAERWGVL